MNQKYSREQLRPWIRHCPMPLLYVYWVLIFPVGLLVGGIPALCEVAADYVNVFREISKYESVAEYRARLKVQENKDG